MIQDLDAAAALLALAVGACLVVSLVAAVVALRAVRRAPAADGDEVALLRAEVEALRAQLAARPERAPQEYVITAVGATDPASDPAAGTPEAVAGERIDGRLFADLVLREGVVQAAALAHGVRRALAPEHRDLVRGAVRREVRRARRQRRADLRADLRAVRRLRVDRSGTGHALLGEEGAA